MKEATGELNMTVVTVVAIVAVGAFFYAFIWPSIQGNLIAQTHCSAAVNCSCNADNTVCECSYYDDEGKIVNDPKITCDLSSKRGQNSQNKNSKTG